MTPIEQAREALILEYAEAVKRNAVEIGMIPIAVLIDHHREFAGKLAALSPLSAAWQPMETAPKDGTHILSIGPGGHVIIHWMPEGYFHDHDPSCWFPATNSTHWMPLPAASFSPTTPVDGVGADLDALAYRFWSVHPKELDEWAKTAPPMPDHYKGGIRAWFFACEMRSALASPEAEARLRERVADIVPEHCTGSSLAFSEGVLYVNKDGSGYIAVAEEHFNLEDDRGEGPDGPEGSVHWITRLAPGELESLRDFLNGAPVAAEARLRERVAELEAERDALKVDLHHARGHAKHLETMWAEARLAQAASGPAVTEAQRLMDEGFDVLTNLTDSIARHGNYSAESTITFIDQARSAFREAYAGLHPQSAAGDEGK